MPVRSLNAHAVLRSLDLMIDGPVRWGQPVRSRAPGIFLVELPSADALAPLDIVAIRAWLARAPSLQLDGARPEPAALADRIRRFWLPGQSVLYVGRTSKSLSARVSALYSTGLGDRRPHSGGHWLKTLKPIDSLRIWWAETGDPELYEDAAVAAIADTVTPEERAALHDPSLVLPWANLESVSGEKRATGLTGSHVDNQAAAPTAAKAPTRPAAATTTRSTATRASSTTRATSTRSTSTTAAAARAATAAKETRVSVPAGGGKPLPPPTHITAAGLASLKRELTELTMIKRPEVILRVKHARELGDLRENADYESARNEQSFLEGRIRALEQLIKTAQVIDADHTGEVLLGSTVQVLVEGEEATLHIVGSTEADPTRGRISNASPVGRALLGHRAGDKVEIVTPARTLHYEILDVRQLES